MTLTNCSDCQFYNSNPHHKGDIRCSLQPAYATMYDRLKNLDSVTLNSLPLDKCRDFKIDPLFAPKEITFSLTFQEWQHLARDSSCSSTIFNFLKERKIEHSLSLTVRDWQKIAFSSRNPYILELLTEHKINAPQSQGNWIDVDSSCINAVAYNWLNSVLKIRFNSSDVYQYSDVPADVFDSLLRSVSKGLYFNSYIKDVYDFQLVDD